MSCSVCGRKFGWTERKYNFGKFQVCFNCMTCSVCGSIAEGEKRYLVETQAFCKECGEKRKIDLLSSALFTYLTGSSSMSEGVNLVILGFLDPLAGLFAQSLGVGTQQKIEDAKETIKQIYLENPDFTKRFIEKAILCSENMLSDMGRKNAMKYRALLDWLEREKGKTSEEDPLKLLKLRYAKGDISKEQYEEMKKTLQLD